MTAERKTNFWFDVVVLALLEILICAAYLAEVPRFYGDETWEASIGYNLAREGAMRHGVIEGWGGMHVNFIQDQVIQPLFCGVSFLIFGYGVVPARLPSVLMAVISVCAIYAIMRELFTRRAALLCAVMLAVNPWFFVIARRVRPEIFALAFAILCLLALLKSRKNSWVWPLLAGAFGAGGTLSHPNGFIMSGCALIAVMIWRRPEKPIKTLCLATTAFVLLVLPFVIYVLLAVRNPEVSFVKQMSGGKLRAAWSASFLLKSELDRWMGYFQWPKGLPLAGLFVMSLIAAFVKSTRADKLLATVIILFALALPVTTVNTAAVYLTLLTPFLAALLARFVQRIWWKVGAECICGAVKNWRAWLAAGMAGAYLLFCAAGMFVLLRFHPSNINMLTDRIAAVTGPTAKVYGNIMLQIGADKFNYGYFPLDEKWEVSVEDIRSRKYEYAVRLCDDFQTSHGVSPMSTKMPAWRSGHIIDEVCRNFGTQVDTFVAPGYGAVEIYKLDWNKPAAADKEFMTKKLKT